MSQSLAQLPNTPSMDRTRRRILWVLIVWFCMALIDVGIVNVALPSIQHDLGATSSDLQWILSGYALTFGVVLIASAVGCARLMMQERLRRCVAAGYAWPLSPDINDEALYGKLHQPEVLSPALSSSWNCMLGLAGFISRSNAAALTAFCSSPVR